MYNEEQEVYLISNSRLESMLKHIISDQIKGLETRLKEKSKIVTRSEAAKILHCCPNTISEFVRTGRIPNRGKGRKILILESDLEGLKPNQYTHYKK